MSDAPGELRAWPPRPEDKLQIEVEKLAYERDKLAAEIPKLRNDNRILNRHAGASVAAAAVVVSVMQLTNTLVNQHEQSQRTAIERDEARLRQDRESLAARARAQEEERRARAERSIRCVQAGIEIADFTRRQIERIAGLDREGVTLLVNSVVRIFPTAEAAAILRAARIALPNQLAGDPAVTAAIAVVLADLDAIGGEAGCDRAPDRVIMGLPPVRSADLAADTSRELAPPVPAASSCPALPPAPVNAEQLTIFPQVVRMEDRDPARSIIDRARILDPQVRREVIEYVRSRNPDTQRAELRYYHHDQEEEARWLKALLERAACMQGLSNALSDINLSYIGDRFANLPRGRIEAWFPRLSP